MTNRGSCRTFTVCVLMSQAHVTAIWWGEFTNNLALRYSEREREKEDEVALRAAGLDEEAVTLGSLGLNESPLGESWLLEWPHKES